MATNRDSVQYAKLVTNKYPGLATEFGGRVCPVPFEHTVVSGETGGASAGVQDTVNLCLLPLNCKVVGLHLSTDNIWASGGVNGTLQIGDSGDDDRYVAAMESYSANGPTATDKPYPGLAFAGQNFIPTTEALRIVVLKWKTANPTVGKKVKGCFMVILAE